MIWAEFIFPRLLPLFDPVVGRLPELRLHRRAALLGVMGQELAALGMGRMVALSETETASPIPSHCAPQEIQPRSFVSVLRDRGERERERGRETLRESIRGKTPTRV